MERYKSYIQRAIASIDCAFKEATTVLTIDYLTDFCPNLIDEEFKGGEIVFLDLPRASGFVSVTDVSLVVIILLKQTNFAWIHVSILSFKNCWSSKW